MLDEASRKAMASRGGKRSHELGLRHVFTQEEAVAAGRKGGIASAASRAQAKAQRTEGAASE